MDVSANSNENGRGAYSHADADPSRWAWGDVAVVLLGLLGMGAVGVYTFGIATAI